MSESLLLDALKETDICVSRAMHVSLDSRWNFTTAGASYSRLYYVTKGGGFLKTADQTVEMTTLTAWLMTVANAAPPAPM